MAPISRVSKPRLLTLRSCSRSLVHRAPTFSNSRRSGLSSSQEVAHFHLKCLKRLRHHSRCQASSETTPRTAKAWITSDSKTRKCFSGVTYCHLTPSIVYKKYNPCNKPSTPKTSRSSSIRSDRRSPAYPSTSLMSRSALTALRMSSLWYRFRKWARRRFVWLKQYHSWLSQRTQIKWMLSTKSSAKCTGTIGKRRRKPV